MLLTPPLGEEQFAFLFLLFQWEGDLPSFYIWGFLGPEALGTKDFLLLSLPVGAEEEAEVTY
jgi:hypothetical protein